MVTSNKPKIVVAFANPKSDLNLGAEFTHLQAKANEENLFETEFIIEAGTTEIYRCFKHIHNRGRICIFQYSGHASKQTLFLNDKLEHGQTIGSFLAQQVGLELVILNACKTDKIGKFIKDSGIPLVIATTNTINDPIAIDFTKKFYHNLFSGISVKEAFENTINSLEKVEGEIINRSLDTGVKTES